MKESFQDLLLFIPLYQLRFLTPLPKQRLYYEKVDNQLPEKLLEIPTLVTVMGEDQWSKLNNREVVNQLIQNSNLIGIVIGEQSQNLIHEDILTLFLECQLPIVQVTNSHSLHMFNNGEHHYYSQFSNELAGAMELGFTKLAAEISVGLETPFLYLDENDQLLWQFGEENEVREANRWVNTHQRELEGMKLGTAVNCKEEQAQFELYSIDIAGFVQQSLVASANLVDWQKRLVDKFIGLTALTLQTEGMFQEQQQRMQEHFVYELLYHKFESKKVMIKQAKAWGWNLEIPHHLLLIHIGLSDELMENIYWLEEMVLTIEEMKSQLKETIIVFPFQDQIVVLLEDGSKATISERSRHVIEVAEQISKELMNQWSHSDLSIGIGKWYQSTTFLNKSYQEANQALKFGQIWFENRNIFHINDLGVLHLLTHIHQEILFDYCQEYLSVLIESDREQGTDFINTLKVYIQHQGNINEVSDALFVHPNTLRKRIKKIEEMTGINLQNPEEFMNLIVALKILSFINS